MIPFKYLRNDKLILKGNLLTFYKACLKAIRTSEPDSAASEATTLTQHLTSLGTTDMVGLKGHIGGPLHVL